MNEDWCNLVGGALKDMPMPAKPDVTTIRLILETIGMANSENNVPPLGRIALEVMNNLTDNDVENILNKVTRVHSLQVVILEYLGEKADFTDPDDKVGIETDILYLTEMINGNDQ